MTERGWTSSREVALQGALLDWVYEASKGDRTPALGTFTDETTGVDKEALDGLVAALRSRDLITLNKRGGGPSSSTAYLTSAGRAAVRTRHERRSNTKARAIAAREALLDWYYEQKRRGGHFPVVDAFLEDVRGSFEGDPFTEKELDDAAGHLKDRGLLKAIGSAERAVLRAEITVEGEDVVENYDGSLAAWGNAQRSGGQQFVTHFNAPVSGQVGIGENVTQTQHQGFDADTLLRLVEDVREAATAVEPAEQAYLLTYLDLVQAEATNEEPNRELMRGAGDRLKVIAAKAGNAGLSASVTTLVGFIAKVLGFDVG